MAMSMSALSLAGLGLDLGLGPVAQPGNGGKVDSPIDVVVAVAQACRVSCFDVCDPTVYQWP